MEKTTTLYNGKQVKEGDKVYFIDSDGNRCEGIIEKRKYDIQLATPHHGSGRSNKKRVLKKGTLFFLNSSFLITDYTNLDTY